MTTRLRGDLAVWLELSALQAADADADAMPAELPPTVRLFPKPWNAGALEALPRGGVGGRLT